MTFSDVNHLAVVVAAVAAWVASSVWYMSLRKPYAAALGKAPVPAFGLYFFAFVADLIIAWVLAGLLGHLGPGQVTLRNGVISGAFMWFGFVLTTMTINYTLFRARSAAFAHRRGELAGRITRGRRGDRAVWLILSHSMNRASLKDASSAGSVRAGAART